MSKIYMRDDLAETISRNKNKRKTVFTNGCFDILHIGHIELLTRAKTLGDFLVVGLNSDDSVRRLKGESRPIHPQHARALVLAALEVVDAVVIFDEDTPIETLRILRPDVHVKGGDYQIEQLPEAETVREIGGEIVIVPLVEGFSSTRALEKMNDSRFVDEAREAVVMIPARWGSTRFPGKPLADLGGETVLSRVVKSVLKANVARPVVVATDDARIQNEIENRFDSSEAIVVFTSPDCHTGTDRLAEAVRARGVNARQIIVNVQGDEPFIDPRHLDALLETMRADGSLRMATLATSFVDEAHELDSNAVKVVVSHQNRALYFSRAPIPFDRENSGARRLRHLGVYAYEANWLLEMAALPPSPLEEREKLEQLRALEHGVAIGVAIVDDVISISIDTPEDLERARKHLIIS